MGRGSESFSFQTLPRLQALSVSLYILRAHGSGWRQAAFSTVSEISVVFLCTGFWNSSKGPFISGEIPLGRLDLDWSLERDRSLSPWSGSTDYKTLNNQRTNAAAAAAAALFQSCPTLCDPIDGSPPGSLVPGILQARTLEWVAISFSSAGK